MTSDSVENEQTILFISDLHLCEARSQTTRAFLGFLDGPALKASRLYILGDLFEYWAGDDDATDFKVLIADALKTLANAGVRVLFMAGNRDFLLGPSYAARAGLELIEDPFELRLAERRYLLTHGDQLCTDDLAYQAFRGQVRNHAWQQAFLARPLQERRQLVEDIRARSESAKRLKASDIMDVNSGAVEGLLRDHDYPTLIHGHTHRPAWHEHVVDNRRCTRVVLEDWDATAPYLEWSAGALHNRTYIPETAVR